ncbi:MAG TPA: PAS domain S-box protein [Flavobacteriales bacterium]|nr:PAS domain S-box protein [Flavobacteriales bacterium]
MLSNVKNINETQSFRSFLNHIHHPIAIHTDGKFVFVNKAGLKLFKVRSAKEIIGRPVLDVVHQDHKEASSQRIKNLYAGKSVAANEQKLLNSKGETIFAIVSGTLVTFDKKPSILVTAQDITEQKIYEAGLSKSETLYQNLVNNMDEGVIRFFADERIQYVNKRFCQIVGYKSLELIGKIGHHFLVDKDSLEIIKKLIKKRRRGKSSKHEIKLIKKNGDRVWVSVSGNPLFDDHKKFLGTINMVTDISEQKNNEAVLESSEKQFSELFENAHDLIQSINQDGKIRYVNKAWLETLEYNNEEAKNLMIWDIIHPDSLEHCMEVFSKVMNGENVKNIETAFVSKNDKKIEVVGNVTVRNLNNGDTATQGIFHDVTENRRANASLQESEEKYRLLIEKMNEGIIRIDVNEKILFANNRFCQMLGYGLDEILGRNIMELLKLDTSSEAIIKSALLLRKKGKPSSYQIKAKKKSGNEIWISINGSPLHKDGKNIGSMGIVMDITKEVLSRKALIDSEINLKQAQEIGHLGSYEWNLITNELKWNEQMFNIYGVEKNVIPTLAMVASLTHPEDIKEMEKVINDSINGNVKQSYEYRILRKDKQLRYAIARSKLFVGLDNKPYKIIGTIQDITEQKLAEIKFIELNESLEKRVIDRTKQLENANNEIKSLLQEMHHRVKNNLQIVASLLNIEANAVDNDYIYEAFKESQDRIQTMAFIHESLYLNESMSEISVRKYLMPLVKDRIRANANTGNQIKLEGEFPDISFKIEKMLPLGLLLNELLTNSLKHAFPNKKKGKIKVSIQQQGKSYLLIYKDNGIGFNLNKIPKNSKSVGLILINSFIMQFEGKLKKINVPGTHYEIKFKAN